MLYKHELVDFCSSDATKAMDRNNAKLDEIDAKQKAAGEILHRYITHPIADGHAVYQIVKVGKRTVRIRVCVGLGDDWAVPAWGNEASIPLKTAEQFLNRRDKLTSLFKG